MIGEHTNVVLEFSGGADSTALLYLARPYLRNITVHFVDPGATFPHVIEHVIRTCATVGARLEIIRPAMPVGEWHAAKGLPSDIVPGWNSAEMAWTMKEPPQRILQPTMSCCAAMLFYPKARALIDSGATLVLRGTKQCDERRGVGPGTVDERGVEYRFPLWTWTDAEVLDYLHREGVALPKHYEHVKDSLDCTVCTGHSGAHYARSRYEYIRKYHPDVWADLAPKLATVRGIIDSETKRHSAVMAFDEEAV